MIRRPPRSTQSRSSAASDVYKRQDWLGCPPDLHLKVEDVEPPDTLLVLVAVVAPHTLVAAGAEGLVAGPREDDDSDGGVVPGDVEGVTQLEERLRPEGVADLGPVDGDPGDPGGGVVEDVLVFAAAIPIHRSDYS